MSHDKPKDSEGQPLDEQAIAQLSGELASVTKPGPELVARMRARIMAGIADSITAVVRAAEGKWSTLLPGVDIKILHVDRVQGTQTALWRLAPGAKIPPHPHSRDEECLVLEGAIVNDGTSYLQGDYLYTNAGMHHTEFIAPSGALLMVRNELLLQLPP